MVILNLACLWQISNKTTLIDEDLLAYLQFLNTLEKRLWLRVIIIPGFLLGVAMLLRKRPFFNNPAYLYQDYQKRIITLLIVVVKSPRTTMKPTVSIQSNRIEISIPITSPIEDLEKWRMLLHKLVLHFQDKIVDILTIAPQKYSLGQEINNGEKHNYGKNNFLINKGIVLSNDLIKAISGSEDFERGLLLIVLSGSPISVIQHLSEIDKSGAELVLLDADGKSFNWYNPSSELDIKDIRALI